MKDGIIKAFPLYAGLLLSISAVVNAADFSVNDTVDGADINPGDGKCLTTGNTCTIRAAIMETNALPGTDTITIPSGFYTLALGNAGEDAAAEGDLDILDDLVITGDDAATTTINGNSFLFRIFSILKRADDSIPKVSISNITMTQGLSNNYGALVFNEGDLTLDNVVLTDASPDSYAVVNNANLTVNGGQISNNTAGIYSQYGVIEISGTTFSDNNGGNVGNPLFIWSGVGRIENSTFSNNIGYDLGGAIHAKASNVSINNSSFSGNSVTPSSNAFAGNGGAITVGRSGGHLRITNSSFNGNQANALGISTMNGAGGAIYIRGQIDSVGIVDSVFTNNSSSGAGGAVFIEDGADRTYLRRVTVDNNSSGSGGGIYVGGGLSAGGSISIVESKITNNTATNSGGGIAFGSRTSISSDLGYIMTNTQISDNTADFAGGVFFSGNGIELNNVTISNNSATTAGGGIYQGDGSTDLIHVTVANNISPSSTASNIENGSGVININHVIVADPQGGGANCNGTISSLGNNLVSDASCGLGVSGDQANTDPLLSPLADNGGFSMTMALQAGSPAINGGSSAFCSSTNSLDQRNYYRGDATCDVGAYEANSTIAQSGTLAFTAANYTVNEGDGVVSVTFSRTNGSQGAVSLAVFDSREGSAYPGSDYADIPFTFIEWADGDSSDKTLPISIYDDINIESDETIQLQLDSVAFVMGGANLGASKATLLINDNDADSTDNNTGDSNDEGGSGAFNLGVLLYLFMLLIFKHQRVYKFKE